MEKFPKPKSPEDIERIDAEIEGLLQELDDYSDLYDKLPELQDQWYEVEMEAKVAKDRAAAKAHLEEFVSLLKSKRE